MGKYQFIENELKPYEVGIGDLPTGMLLTDFLKSLPLVNPNILLNDKKLFDNEGNVLLNIDDTYRLKEDDRLLIVNQVKGIETILITIAVSLAVSYALTTLLAPKISTPTPTSTQQQQGTKEYSINTSQNSAKAGDPIPECFGTYVRYPDIISPIYQRYVDNKEYLYMLLCVGVGQHTINQLYIDDTPIEDLTIGTFTYSLYKTENLHSGNNLIKNDWITTHSDNYFRDIVITATELENFKLTTATGSEMSEFQLNNSSAKIDLIEFDIKFNNGLFTQNDNGTLGSRSIDIKFTITDEFSTVTTYTETITNNTRNQIQLTYSYPVTTGVYSVKAERLTADATDTKIQDEVYCVRIKGYVVNEDSVPNGTEYLRYGDVTLLAVKIKATEGISGKGQFKVKVKATRDNISTLTECLNYVWTSENGGRQPLNKISLPSSMDNYSFNYALEKRTTVLKAMQSIATSSRYNLYSSMDVMTAKLDEAQPITKMMFNETNIVRDTLKINMSANDESDYDGIRVIYKDPDTFENLYYTYPTNANFPEDVTLDGVTDSTKAIAQAKFIYNTTIYRNITYNFDTELDGLVPSLFDKCAITHPVLKTSQSGVINGFTTNQIELNEVIREDYTDPYIFFRARDGKPSILYHILSVNGRVVTLDVSVNPLPTDLYIGEDEQRTIYSLGDLGFIDEIIITEIKPKSNNRVSVKAVNYDERVYL